MKHATLFSCLSALLMGIFLLGRPTASLAQTYTVPTSGTTSITTCAGTIYTDGGANGSYSANDNGTTTIMPGTTGNKVRLDFTTFYVESNYDYLYIYDGTSVSAPLIGTYTGTSSPGTVYGTTSSGALTLRFSSDNSVQYTGFAASISCVTSVPLPDLTVQSATISPTSAVAGSVVSASAQIYNLTGSTASSSSMGYYLSTDNTLSSNDVFLSSTAGGVLSAGQSASRYASLTIPAGTAAGTYYVLFVADYQNQVAETNEDNNVTPVGITVQAAAPDLLIQNASLSSTSAQAGTAITFSCSIYNQGNIATSSSSVGFYFSADATLDANDQLLTAQYGSSLGAGYSASRTGTAAIPTNTATGNYYILFAADYQNQVAESNENNNVTAVSITVAPPGPDLTVTSQYLYSTYLTAGSSTTGYAYINNIGNQTASSSTLGFYLSTNATFDANDVLLSTVTGGTLAAGGSSYRSATLNIPATTAAGTYYVLFVADPANAVTESNENNNVAYSTLTVYASTIDLSIYSASVTPTTTSAGSTLSTSGYVYNQGNSTAGSSSVGYYLSTNTTLDASDVLMGSTIVSSVSASYTSSFYGSATIPANTASGNYYVLFVADYLNQIVETNKNNNVSYQYITVVAPGIDLNISSAYLSTTSTTAGNTVSMSCYLNNTGTTAASNAVVGYYLSTNTTFDANDVLLASNPGTTVGASSSVSRSASATIPAGTAAGTYYVLFVADPANTITETNENNNVSYQYLTVTAPSIDLYMYSGYLSSSTATAGTTLSTTGYIYNQGSSVASPVTLGYYLSTNTTLDANDVLVGNSSLSSLYGGYGSYLYGSATIPAGTASGNYYILFVADYLNQLVETNKNNNITYQYVTVTALSPDLVIQSAALASTATPAGSSLGASCSVANIGNGSASSSNAGYYLSTNTLFDAGDVLLASSTGGTLAAGQTTAYTTTLAVPAGTAVGTYYVLFIADPTNTVAESNESNNLAYRTLTITASFAGTLVPASGSASITSCSATIYDNGGTSNYADNSDGTLTINPASANAQVSLTFSVFNTESGSDYLEVYDGTTTSAPKLGTYSGAQLPGTITASPSNASGALTLRFVSNATLNSLGFVANASCSLRLATLPQQTAGYEVNVLPNPVAGAVPLRVQLSGAGQAGTATLTLLNSVGQQVATRTLSLSSSRLNEAELPTTGLAAGVYVLRLSGTNLNVVRRVVIE